MRVFHRLVVCIGIIRLFFLAAAITDHACRAVSVGPSVGLDVAAVLLVGALGFERPHAELPSAIGRRL